MPTVVNRIASFLSSGYDAITSTGKRKSASSIIKHEDSMVKGQHRRQLMGAGNYLHRNFSVVAWAIRKHLDYVTQFDFQMRTESDEFNQQAERLMLDWFRPANCDIAGRHPFPKFLRMLEARRTLDGDVFVVKRSGGLLQAVEGDKVRDPEKIPDGQMWFNGCHVNRDGRALRWAMWNRHNHNVYKFSNYARASNVIQHACFERFDQCRGISPLTAAYNSFQDVYEGVDYALAKMKVEQMFAMIVTSSATEGLGDHENDGDGYSVDFGKGPIKLEMDPGDDAKFLGADSPGGNTQEFLHTVIGMAIKALDLPFNFYDESHTNFFGSRAAWLLYDRSCQAKRADVIELLRKITVWRLQLWIQDGVLRLPSGMTLGDVPFEWVPRGMPWWDPAKEITGQVQAINAGLDTPQRVCRQTGTDFEDNLKQIAKAKELAEQYGVDLSFAVQSEPSRPNPIPDEQETEDVESE